jgi:hypothetical protein
MKFLITLLLLTSFSVFAEPGEGENDNATTENVTQPCNAAVDDQVTASDKKEEVKDAESVPTETKQQ